MKEILNILPIVLYFIVGIISLIMAAKSLFSKKFISFHEKAAGQSLDSLDKPLQIVILALMKVSGLGFLVVALLLLIFPIINYFFTDNFTKFAIPAVSLIYCTGLFIINYYLYKHTKSKTPWRGSIAAMIILLAGMILSTL